MTKLAALIAASLLSTVALAQGYPNRPVRVIVPWPPGQATDIAARVVAEKLQQALKQPFIIDNRAGAGAVVDDERLLERLLQLLGYHARGDVGGLPRRPRHDDSHGPVRVALRERDRGKKRCGYECGELRHVSSSV